MKKIMLLVLMMCSVCFGFLPSGTGKSGVVTIAASDSSDSAKRVATYICDGTRDELVINEVIADVFNAGGGTVELLDGTYNIWTCVNLRASYGDNPANPHDLVLQGQGWNTILKREVVSGTVDSISTVTLNSDEAIFDSGMVADKTMVMFDSTQNCYDITGFTDSTTVTLASSAAGESGTFKISTDWHVVSQFGAGYNMLLRDFAVDGSNFGDSGTAANKGLFINGNTSDWTLCHHITLDNIYAYDVRSEALCIDYSQWMKITNCKTYNSSWAGCTLAQVAYGEISGCQIEESGTVPANPAGSFTQHYGINMQCCTYCVAKNNWIHHPRGGGIAIASLDGAANVGTYGSGHCTIRDNTITSSQPMTSTVGVGIIAVVGTTAQSSTYGNLIDGNTVTRDLEIGNGGTWITGSGQVAIRVKWARDTVITNNVFTGFGNTCIYLVAGTSETECQRTIVANNTIGCLYVNDIYDVNTVDTVDGNNFDLDDDDLTIIADFSLSPAMSGYKQITNTGASGNVTYILPKAQIGLVFKFVHANNVHQMKIDPYGTETLSNTVDGDQLGAGIYTYSATNADTITLLCETAGQWECKAVTGWTTYEE